LNRPAAVRQRAAIALHWECAFGLCPARGSAAPARAARRLATYRGRILTMEALTEDQRAQLRQALDARLEQLQDQISAELVTDGLPVQEVETSPADKATNRLLNDLALEAAGHLATQLTAVRKALAKFDDGSYGMCEVCGNDIGFARLLARPEAALCITCQSRLEKR
jgi:DnaK suppressor protein